MGGLLALAMLCSAPQAIPWIANEGQWEPEIRFAAFGQDRRLAVLDGGWVLDLFPEVEYHHDDAFAPSRVLGEGHRVSFEFVGGEAERVRALGARGAPHHFLRRGEGSATGVPSCAAVVQQGVWPGVDLEFRGATDCLEYDLVLDAGAGVAQLVIAVYGAEGLHVDEAGDLWVSTPAGQLRQSRPRSWQIDAQGKHVPVHSAFRLLGADRIGFELGALDARWPTRIDPGLEWGTYLGGGEHDTLRGIDDAPDGALVVVGTTLSTDFPTTVGAFDEDYNGHGGLPAPVGDIYVACIEPDGSAFRYVSYIGGSANEQANAVVVDDLGRATLTGWTASDDFPVTPGAYDETYNGASDGDDHFGGDVFVARLSADGASLDYATYLGGDRIEYALSLDLTTSYEATISGHVHSANYPTTAGVWQEVWVKPAEMQVTRLSSDGSALVWSTFLGGDKEEYGRGLYVDAAGRTILVGPTNAPTYPVTPNALDASYNGGSDHFADGFVTVLSPDASALEYSSFFGSPGNEHFHACTMDSRGRLIVAGQADSSTFPVTPGAFDTSFNGVRDGTVTVFGPGFDTLESSTFLGGSANDRLLGVDVDAALCILVSGVTSSPDYPTTPGALDRTLDGSSDVALTRLSGTLDSLWYSTYFGGSAGDFSRGGVYTRRGPAGVGMDTSSADLPAGPGAPQPSYQGMGDAFVAQLDLLPTGARRFGASTPGSRGPIPIGVTAQPSIAAPFELAAWNARPGAVGLLLVGRTALDVPQTFGGVDLWIEPLWTQLVSADQDGTARVAAPAKPLLPGARVVAQCVFLDLGGLAASSALEIVFQ